METILLHKITPEQLYNTIRAIIKEEMKQDQLFTKEGALKFAGISNATLLKAIQDGIVKPQLVKGRKKAMYLETEILNIPKVKRKREQIRAQSGHQEQA